MNDGKSNDQSSGTDGLIFSRNTQSSCEECKQESCVCNQSATEQDDKADTETRTITTDENGKKKRPNISWI